MIPEFAFDPAGRRLLWTENRYPPDVRVDQGCVIRRIRSGILRRLTGVDEVGEIPFDIDREIRNEVAELLRDPTGYSPGPAVAAPDPPRRRRSSSARGSDGSIRASLDRRSSGVRQSAQIR